MRPRSLRPRSLRQRSLRQSSLRPRICASIAAAALFILGHAATFVQAQTKAPPALTGTVTSAEEGALVWA